jgi:hypothetical protein
MSNRRRFDNGVEDAALRRRDAPRRSGGVVQNCGERLDVGFGSSAIAGFDRFSQTWQDQRFAGVRQSLTHWRAAEPREAVSS